jgi:hypothetical protein
MRTFYDDWETGNSSSFSDERPICGTLFNACPGGFMRHKATVPVIVPPTQPAGVLHDLYDPESMGFPRKTDQMREGARVRIRGGHEVQPSWLPEFSGRAGVLGILVRYIPITAKLGKEAVIRLDRTLEVDGHEGNYLVLHLTDPSTQWTNGAKVRVELCAFEPNVRFLRNRDCGLVVETSAICELL